MASATADPISTPVTVRPGVYVTTPQVAQCRACNRRWRLEITGDPKRGVEALWRKADP